MAPPDRRSKGRAILTALVVLLVMTLGVAVLYLLSDINSRRYRIGSDGTSLVIERGRKLPWGFRAFEPPTPELTAAYAPIPMPPGDAFTKTEIFDDRADVDRALFSLFAGWARDRLNSTTPGDFDLAASYVRRSQLLPSLSEEQRLELRRLRADVAYHNGRRMLDEIADRLQKALAELRLAKELGASRPSEVEQSIAEVERRLRDFNASPAGVMGAVPAEAPIPSSGAAEASSGNTPEPPVHRPIVPSSASGKTSADGAAGPQ